VSFPSVHFWLYRGRLQTSNLKPICSPLGLLPAHILASQVLSMSTRQRNLNGDRISPWGTPFFSSHWSVSPCSVIIDLSERVFRLWRSALIFGGTRTLFSAASPAQNSTLSKAARRSRYANNAMCTGLYFLGGVRFVVASGLFVYRLHYSYRVHDIHIPVPGRKAN
jgi:hypothetical protein